MFEFDAKVALRLRSTFTSSVALSFMAIIFCCYLLSSKGSRLLWFLLWPFCFDGVTFPIFFDAASWSYKRELRKLSICYIKFLEDASLEIA